MVDLHGFATNGLYYKSLLDKLKVSTHVFRVGTYKSAVEPFIRDDMSPAAREADSRWIGELWQNYLNTVAANRQIPAQQVFPGAQGLLEGLTKPWRYREICAGKQAGRCTGIECRNRKNSDQRVRLE